MARHYNYYESQLAAIEELYRKLAQTSEKHPSMQEVIVSWFTEGYAEKFREDFFQTETMAVQ